MNKNVILFLRILTGLIFAFAGFSKLIEPYENFRGMINNYQIIPYAWSTPVAMVMPWFEFVFGIFMILGYLPKMTSAVLAALSLTFLVVIGASNALLDSALQDCGCFGQTGPLHLKIWQVFIMDFLLMGFCSYYASLKSYPFSLHSALRNKSFD